MDPLCQINKNLVTQANFHFGNTGAWFADLRLAEEAKLSGAVVIKLGSAELKGTVDPSASGTFVYNQSVRVIGGGGGWGKLLPAKNYHNDATVKALNVAQDAAREAGEVLGDFKPSSSGLGKNYARRAATASRALEDAIGNAPWWVGLDGKTHVGSRPASKIKGLTLSTWDPAKQQITVTIDSNDPADLISKLGGSFTDSRLPTPVVIREIRLDITDSSMVAHCWVGGDDKSLSQNVQLLRDIVRKSNDEQLYGCYSYRIVTQANDLLDLQVVSKAAGLPSMVKVPVRPGVAGVKSTYVPGTLVVVQFLDADPRQPIVVGFQEAGQPGFAPTITSFNNGTRPVARTGDTVMVMIGTPGTPIAMSGVIGVAPAATPFVGTIVITTPVMGVIQGGSPEVVVP